MKLIHLLAALFRPSEQGRYGRINTALLKIYPGIRLFALPSGAGHMQIMDLLSGYDLRPLQNGVSCSPAEWSSKEDCAVGGIVLY